MNTPAGEQIDRIALATQVREALQGLMEVDRSDWNERGILILGGRLTGPARGHYKAIRARLEALGFTPFLQRRDQQDELQVVPGVAKHPPSRIGLPVGLFIATIFSVLLTGALREQQFCADTLTYLRVLASHPADLLLGIPFTATLIGILFAHEMGHYVVGRLRHAPVSLPYFIPLPLITIFGTLGAVIVQREPMEDRRSVLELGIAGPLAGLVIAIPLLIYGLATSPVGPPRPPLPGCEPGYLQEGNSLLYIAAKWLIFGQFLPSGGIDVQLNAVAMAAWAGLLVTMLNLLPIGQLDGGHVAYALLGRKATYLSYGTIALCLGLAVLGPLFGLIGTETWLVLPVLMLLLGPQHPPPLNDISRLGRWHAALAIFGLLVFVLLFMPSPLAIVTR